MNGLRELKLSTSEKTERYIAMNNQVNYSHIYARAGICYVVLDSAGDIIEFNSAAESLFDVDKDDIIGKNFRTLAIHGEEKALDKMIRTCMRRGLLKDEKLYLRSGINNKCFVKLNGKAESTEINEDAAILLFIQDISTVELKQIQNDLLKFILNLDENASKLPDTISHILMGLKTLSGCKVVGLSTLESNYEINGEKAALDKIYNNRKISNDWESLADYCIQGNSCSCDDNGGFIINGIPDISDVSTEGLNQEFITDISNYNFIYIIKSNENFNECLYFLNDEKIIFTQDQIEFFAAAASIFKSRQINDPQAGSGVEQNKNNFSTFQNPVSGIVNLENGIITDVNEWIIRFTGYEKEYLVGKSYSELIPIEYSEEIANLEKKYADGRWCDEAIEISIFDKDGNMRGIECALEHSTENGKSVDTWYWINKEEMHWLQRQLFQARKMESLGLLSGGIVHDFNNLMASILGYSSLLNEELKPSDPYYDDIKQIHDTSEKATELTTRLMAYAHGSEYVVDKLDVNQLVTEVAGILSRTLDKNIMIRAELDPKLDSITADASQIQQVILQVALNARDAMPTGGKIIFNTRNITVKENSAWIKQGAQPGSYIQLAVSDTGKGMSLDVKEHIFKPHFTTQDGDSGKGLGLSMVNDIVSSHKGFISVFSEPGKGSMFKIYFPANLITDEDTFSFDKNKPVLGKETILLIDNERTSRETARKMLTRYGYKVISAESGREAAIIHKKYSERVDLIILDMLMPGINTNKMILHFRQINPEIKIMAASSKGELTRMETVVKEKLSGVIIKPFQVRPLLQSIRTVFNA